MANAFSKDEIVYFDELLSEFEDRLVMSRQVALYQTEAQAGERQSYTFWRPVPYIVPSIADNLDLSAVTANQYTQMAVPATIDKTSTVPLDLSTREANDQLQSKRLGRAAMTKISSDINRSVSLLAANQGTLVVKRTTAAAGFDDVAAADALMNEQGISQEDRKLFLSTRDYNGMASNLAARGTLEERAERAYEKGRVGMVNDFDTYKLDIAERLTLAAGVTVTVNGANQRYVPVAVTSGNNVDNRYQNLAITVTSGTVKVGDTFTIAGVNAVHHITKQDTGQLKTFRIHAIVSGAGGTGTVTISPPIIAADSSPTMAESQYKNVTATPASGAAITWLNTVSAFVNPFWVKDAIELLPGHFSNENEAGLSVLKYKTEQGVQIQISKSQDFNTLKWRYRWDASWGVVMTNPQMAGIMLFSQS